MPNATVGEQERVANEMIYDLTQRLMTGVPHFAGDPEVRIEAPASPHEWQVSALHLGSHSGTHMDAPKHVWSERQGIGSYHVQRFVGPGLVIDATGLAENAPIGPNVLAQERHLLKPGTFLIIRTGWDQRWGADQYFRHPYVSPELAAEIVAAGVTLVAIDALNVDSTVDGTVATHELLLGSDILIVENLTGLNQLFAGERYFFVFAPLALVDVDGAPVRAIAWDSGHSFTSSGLA